MTDTIGNRQLTGPAGFTIQEATVDDAERIVEYLSDILSDPMASIADLDEMMLNVHRQREHIRRSAAGTGSCCLIAVSMGEVVGFLTMEAGRRRKISHTVELGMSVSKHWRGRGVGQELLSKAISWASATGLFHKVVLNVFSNNIAALKLYEKAGFREEGRLVNQIQYCGTYQDLILMAYFLTEVRMEGRL